MATTILILKWTITLVFAFTGSSKIFLPKAKLIDKGLQGLMDVDEKRIKVAGLLEVLGVLGLILPTLLSASPVLSGFSALCLCLTMDLAGWTNYKFKLSVIANIVIIVICLLIAYWELK